MLFTETWGNQQKIRKDQQYLEIIIMKMDQSNKLTKGIPTYIYKQ